MKFFTHLLLIASLCGGLLACSPTSGGSDTTQATTGPYEANPALPGFDTEHSDAEAIAIADQVMEAMGGRDAWNETRYIAWDFFGNRRLTWDKWTGDVRIEGLKKDFTYLTNIHSQEGSATEAGEMVTNSDSLADRMHKALSIWINDSYWLVMPFKLKDSGVTLTYVGTDTTQAGGSADVLELRFKDVGLYPQHKYQVWVDKESHLVSQWSYYPQADLTEPRFINPWENYVQQGTIMLSSGRGNKELTNIVVSDSIDRNIFEQL